MEFEIGIVALVVYDSYSIQQFLMDKRQDRQCPYRELLQPQLHLLGMVFSQQSQKPIQNAPEVRKLLVTENTYKIDVNKCRLNLLLETRKQLFPFSFSS
jgi:hypothetical protein